MKKVMLISALISLCLPAGAQNFFSKIIDYGGDDREGHLYNIIPLENEIKVIGLVHDSLVPGFEGGNWPVLGSVSYDGEYLGTHYLTDSLYSTGFVYFTRRIIFKNDSICYLYDRRHLGGRYYTPCLVELNYRTGRILRSKIIYNETTSDELFIVLTLAIGRNDNLYLVNTIEQISAKYQILTILDSAFNVLSQSVLPGFERKNFTNFMEVDDEGNLIMVGMSLGKKIPAYWESKLYRQVLDTNLVSVDFRLASTAGDHSIVLADSYPIIKSDAGDWVVATQRVVKTPDCNDCSIWVPYVVCISNDFTEVRWETRMFKGNIKSTKPSYMASALTEVSDGFIFAGTSDGGFGIETSGMLGKVGLNGDSLWLKHYIPAEWDTAQARWFL